MVGGSGSSSCANCDCPDKSQCVKEQLNSCSWKNFGKSMVEYGVGGAVTGGVAHLLLLLVQGLVPQSVVQGAC